MKIWENSLVGEGVVIRIGRLPVQTSIEIRDPVSGSWRHSGQNS